MMPAYFSVLFTQPSQFRFIKLHPSVAKTTKLRLHVAQFTVTIRTFRYSCLKTFPANIRSLSYYSGHNNERVNPSNLLKNIFSPPPGEIKCQDFATNNHFHIFFCYFFVYLSFRPLLHQCYALSPYSAD